MLKTVLSYGPLLLFAVLVTLTESPAQTLSPATLSFDSQVLNTSSSAKVITLTNGPTSALTIAGITISGDFAASSLCPISPKTLAGGASCTISVTFTPTTAGARSGQVTVVDNAATSPQSVALSGVGVLPAALSTNSSYFGNQVVNVPSAVITVKLVNNQKIPLTISSISITGDFAQSSNCPLAPGMLAAAGSCNISITFTPTAVNTRTGTLTVVDNTANSPQSVALSGNGVLPVSLSTRCPLARKSGCEPAKHSQDGQTGK